MTDQTSRRAMLGLTSGAIVTGLAGCLTGSDQPESNSDDDEDGHNTSEDTHSHGSHSEELNGPSAEAEVIMTTTESDDHFEPHVVWVEKGGTVNWINESGSHSATAYHPDNDEPQLAPDEAAAWDSGVLSDQEATFDHTFETEGVYHYYCAPHKATGMIGSVIVGQPDPDTQPASADPPSEKSETIREKLADLNETTRDALKDDHGDEGDNEDDHDDGDDDANDDSHDDHEH